MQWSLIAVVRPMQAHDQGVGQTLHGSAVHRQLPRLVGSRGRPGRGTEQLLYRCKGAPQGSQVQRAVAVLVLQHAVEAAQDRLVGDAR